jgi:flagellar hook assembly protein FlgD
MSDELTVEKPANTRRPAAPVHLRAQLIGAQSVQVEWTKSDYSVPNEVYDVYVDGELVDSVEDAFIQINDLTPLTTYKVTVKSRSMIDEEDVVSAESVPLVVKTVRAAIEDDEVAPRIMIAEMGDVTAATALPIKYGLNGSGFVSVKLLNAANAVLATPVNNQFHLAGEFATTLGLPASYKSGVYLVEFTVRARSGSNYYTAYKSFTLDRTKPTVSASTATDLTGVNGSSIITYTLSEDAAVTATVFDGGNKVAVRELTTEDLQPVGENKLPWNGLGNNNKPVADGTYIVRVTAKDRAGNVSAVRTVTVKVERSTPTITDVSNTPNPFIVGGKNTVAIKFTLSESAKVTLKIFASDGTTEVRTLLNGVTRAAGVNTVTWEGRSTSAKGTPVTAGTYVYKIEAVDAALKVSTVVTDSITVQ